VENAGHLCRNQVIVAARPPEQQQKRVTHHPQQSHKYSLPPPVQRCDFKTMQTLELGHCNAASNLLPWSMSTEMCTACKHALPWNMQTAAHCPSGNKQLQFRSCQQQLVHAKACCHYTHSQQVDGRHPSSSLPQLLPVGHHRLQGPALNVVHGDGPAVQEQQTSSVRYELMSC
jgi:hypothetical protein